MKEKNWTTETPNANKGIIIRGELSDMGIHFLTPFGVTVCGIPTVDTSAKDFPQLKNPQMNDLICEYDLAGEGQSISCNNCLSMIELFRTLNKLK